MKRNYYIPENLARATPDMTDRALLDLPESFTEFRHLLVSIVEMRELIKMNSSELVSIVESGIAKISLRFCAGLILAQIGDPRINTQSPQMIEIPGSTVRIGLPSDELDKTMDDLADLNLDRRWILKEVPCHYIKLNDYNIAKYQVTNREYRDFLKDSKEQRIPRTWFLGRYPEETENHPVTGIQAEDADCYAAWLAKLTGRKFRLPTEAEWEYAAAGPRSLRYPWGDIFLPDHANTAECGIFTTTPIGMFALGASPFGCMDMAGNVEEFVSDNYSPYPGGELIHDDLINVAGTHRIARGGSFTRFRDLARNTRRHGNFPRKIYVMGFRLAESI